MTHLYEKGLFAAAYVAVCLWTVYEWIQPVNGHAVAEEAVGHLLIIGALYGFFRLMIARSLHWNCLAWGTVAADMLFGVYFWYDASAAGIHRYLMLSDPALFYRMLGLYMVIRSGLLLQQNGGFSMMQGGQRYVVGAAFAAAAGLAAAVMQVPVSAAVCILAGTGAALLGWTGELEENHPFPY